MKKRGRTTTLESVCGREPAGGLAVWPRASPIDASRVLRQDPPARPESADERTGRHE